MLPEKWSTEWYSLTTTEELMNLLRKAKMSDHDPDKLVSVWRNRIICMEAELHRREFEDQDLMDERYSLNR